MSVDRFYLKKQKKNKSGCGWIRTFGLFCMLADSWFCFAAIAIATAQIAYDILQIQNKKFVIFFTDNFVTLHNTIYHSMQSEYRTHSPQKTRLQGEFQPSPRRSLPLQNRRSPSPKVSKQINDLKILYTLFITAVSSATAIRTMGLYKGLRCLFIKKSILNNFVF